MPTATLTRPTQAEKARRVPIVSPEGAPHYYYAWFDAPIVTRLPQSCWASVEYHQGCGCLIRHDLEYVPTDPDAAHEQLAKIARFWSETTCRACESASAEDRAEGSGEHYLDHAPSCDGPDCDLDSCPLFDAYAESLGGAL